MAKANAMNSTAALPSPEDAARRIFLAEISLWLTKASDLSPAVSVWLYFSLASYLSSLCLSVSLSRVLVSCRSASFSLSLQVSPCVALCAEPPCVALCRPVHPVPDCVALHTLCCPVLLSHRLDQAPPALNTIPAKASDPLSVWTAAGHLELHQLLGGCDRLREGGTRLKVPLYGLSL